MKHKTDEERHKEWLKHFGEEMAKLPEGTHCCGNCRFHLPSTGWHTVTCSKHHGGSGVKAVYAEEYTRCPDWDGIIQVEPKPSKSRLLTEKEGMLAEARYIERAKREEVMLELPLRGWRRDECLKEAQRDLTASIKDQEWRQYIEVLEIDEKKAYEAGIAKTASIVDKQARQKLGSIKCPLCGGSGEVLNKKARMMGYTLAEGETIDEELIPCPLCERVKQARQEMVGEIEKKATFVVAESDKVLLQGFNKPNAILLRLQDLQELKRGVE